MLCRKPPRQVFSGRGQYTLSFDSKFKKKIKRITLYSDKNNKGYGIYCVNCICAYYFILDCGTPPTLTHGSVDPDVVGVTTYGATATQVCNIGYSHSSSQATSLSCLATGIWQPVTITCLIKGESKQLSKLFVLLQLSAFCDICIYNRRFSLFLIMEENTTNHDQTALLSEVMCEVKSGLILILMSRRSRVDCIMDRERV